MRKSESVKSGDRLQEPDKTAGAEDDPEGPGVDPLQRARMARASERRRGAKGEGPAPVEVPVDMAGTRHTLVADPQSQHVEIHTEPL
jgi:hypothetical protein